MFLPLEKSSESKAGSAKGLINVLSTAPLQGNIDCDKGLLLVVVVKESLRPRESIASTAVISPDPTLAFFLEEGLGDNLGYLEWIRVE